MFGSHCEEVAEFAPMPRVYLLRKVHGLSHKEIAEHLAIAVGTVEKHLMKATERCERCERESGVTRKSGGLAPITGSGEGRQ